MNYAEQFIMTNMEKLPAASIPMLRQQLSKLTNEQTQMLMGTELKDPSTTTLFAVLLGGVAGDRFYLGKTNEALVKLLIFWFLFLFVGPFTLWIPSTIYVIIDWFRASDRTKQYNLNKINLALSSITMVNSNQMNTQQPIQDQQQNVAAQQPFQGQMAQPQQPVQPQAAQVQQNMQSSVAPQSTSSVNRDASMNSQDSNNSTL